MTAPERILATLNRYPLKSLLLGSVTLAVLFCLLVVGYLRVSQGIAFRMVDSLITLDNVISDLCLKSTAAMIDARRLEKDFLLNYQEFGFEESRSRYITRLLTVVVGIRENLDRIRALAGNRETAQLTREIEGALDRYIRGVEAMADKLAERGHHESGIHREMETTVREMERLLGGIGSDGPLAKLLMAKVAEEEYIETTRDRDVLAFRAAFQRFDDDAVAAQLPQGVGVELAGLAGRYRTSFERYVLLTEELRVLKKEYLRSVQLIDPLLEKLYVGSLERVAAKRRAIERSTRLLGVPVIAVGGIVLAMTALVSLAITLTVTRSVNESKAFAQRIAAGDRGSRLVPAGKNEFFSLATALNTMAESLQEADRTRQASIAALRESEEKYRSFVETSTDWIWAIDLQGRHTFSNSRVTDILGIVQEEVLGASFERLLYPEDLALAREVLDASVAAGKGWQGVVLRWRHKDGTYRWIESNAVAVTDARGALVGFRGVDRDITERRRLEEQLVKTQKLEAIGTLAGGIAHDFNNLLQGLFGYISLARISLNRPEDAGKMLEQAERALSLSVNLTTQLLTFAKGGQPVKQRIGLPPTLEDAVKFALSGSRCGYRIAFGEGLWSVDADAGQLAQVLQNLVLNGCEAMPDGGTVEIDARNVGIAAGSNALVPAGGDFVRIAVRDAGAGIPEQHLARIFDPYYTTKQQGSGLGLATSYSIVRNHGGFIEVNSRIGLGSEFSLFLPAVPGEERAEPEAVVAIAGRTGRILLMDDVELVRDVAAKLIASLGHEVSTAASGEEALALFQSALEQQRPYDVVILDLTVKNGMGGKTACRCLLEIDPDAKVVVSSGYSDAAVLSDFRTYGFSAALNKPYRLEALRDCLLALLPLSGTGAMSLRSG